MIKKILVGNLIETNCYIIFDENTKDAMVIDPGEKSEKITDFINENNLIVKYIYLTHCHFDHVMGAAWLKEETSAQIVTLDKEKENLEDTDVNMGKAMVLTPICLIPDKVFFEGDEIQIGELNFKVIHTPGHTSGSSCLYGEGILISGDTLFKGTYGRCDLPTGNLYKIVESIKEKLYTLPDSTIVYPGHGIDTTIFNEKKNDEF